MLTKQKTASEGGNSRIKDNVHVHVPNDLNAHVPNNLDLRYFFTDPKFSDCVIRLPEKKQKQKQKEMCNKEREIACENENEDES